MPPSVSVVLPCYNRGQYLDTTLRSIAVQGYPDLDIIVVEDGKDHQTEEVSKYFGARYFRHERTEHYPPFQSVSKVFNIGVKQSDADVLILQAPEVYHDGSVILPLVTAMGKGRAIAQTVALPKDGYPDRLFLGSSGARPQAIYRKDFWSIGGFEEGFFGYGYEDDFFAWLLERNCIPVTNIAARTVHQWHEPTPFEPFTGHANRSYCWTLINEILWDNRPAIANNGGIRFFAPITEDQIYSLLAKVQHFDCGQYHAWATAWKRGERNDDDTFAARNIASARIAYGVDVPTLFIATRAAEAAWALQWAAKCNQEIFKVHDPAWKDRLFTCMNRHLALASIAVRTAERVLNGEEPRI